MFETTSNRINKFNGKPTQRITWNWKVYKFDNNIMVGRLCWYQAKIAKTKRATGLTHSFRQHELVNVLGVFGDCYPFFRLMKRTDSKGPIPIASKKNLLLCTICLNILLKDCCRYALKVEWSIWIGVHVTNVRRRFIVIIAIYGNFPLRNQSI